MFSSFLTTSIFGRAHKEGLIELELVNLREFGKGNYRQLDDYAFGSGGMLYAAPQLKSALDSIKHKDVRPFVVFPSPQGVLITQEIIETLAVHEHVVIICGHYEGIDERFVERYVDLEVSIGDCVLTGGEIPAMMIVDAMSRLVPGVVGKGKAVIEDSFYRGMLDNPNYTRPYEWEGLKVPEVLLSGNAKEISRWRRRIAIERTIMRRPDLLSRAAIREYICDVNIAVIAESADINLEGLTELSNAYELGRPYVIARTRELREAIKAKYPGMKVLGSIERLTEGKEREKNLLMIKVFAGSVLNSNHSLEIKRRCLEHEGDLLFVFSEDETRLEALSGLSCCIYGESMKLPMNVKIGILLDKVIGKR